MMTKAQALSFDSMRLIELFVELFSVYGEKKLTEIFRVFLKYKPANENTKKYLVAKTTIFLFCTNKGVVLDNINNPKSRDEDDAEYRRVLVVGCFYILGINSKTRVSELTGVPRTSVHLFLSEYEDRKTSPQFFSKFFDDLTVFQDISKDVNQLNLDQNE